MQKIIVFLVISLSVSLNFAFAQCGPDGTQPCPKKIPAISANQSKELAAKQRAERERAAQDKLERLRAQQLRLKRKQLEQQKAKETKQLIDNILKYSDSLKNEKPIELFPVDYVTLGKTGKQLFALTPSAKKCEYANDCYVVEGIYYYLDEKGISESLYLSRLRLEGMPDNWKKAGFDWDLSYNEWMNLFKSMGYYSFAPQGTTVESQSGKKFLKAEVLTWVSTPQGKAQIVLKFNYGYGKTLLTDKGTLFAIEINKPN